jgi:hypothetical protein
LKNCNRLFHANALTLRTTLKIPVVARDEFVQRMRTRVNNMKRSFKNDLRTSDSASVTNQKIRRKQNNNDDDDDNDDDNDDKYDSDLFRKSDDDTSSRASTIHHRNMIRSDLISFDDVVDVAKTSSSNVLPLNSNGIHGLVSIWVCNWVLMIAV